MAGLLDFLVPQSSSGIGAGLLDYLNQPIYLAPNRKPSEADKGDSFVNALSQYPYEGALPQLNPPASIWDQPGIQYSAAPPVAPQWGQGSPFSTFLPQAPAPVMAPAPPPSASAPQAAPQANAGPINTMNVGGAPMPQFGSPADYTPRPSSSALNANAQASAPEPAGNPAFLSQTGDRLGAGFQNFVNAGSPLQALGGLITGLATGSRTDPLGIQQQNQNAQFQATRAALIANGVAPQQASATAMLSVLNPEAAKTVLPELLTNKQKLEKFKDQFGAEVPAFVNQIDQTINGKPIDQYLSGGSGGAPNSFYAPGVTYNPNLTGEAYLNQFSPEMKAAVRSYINGDVMPTGNPRQATINSAAKTIAQKYGSDMGIEVSDATYSKKRQMQTELGKSSANSLGGILSNGKSAFEHLKTYSDALANVGNASSDLPLGGIGANVYNAVTNAASGSSQKGKISQANEAGLKYGQESTKFYAGSGGGEAERMAALKANNPNYTSGKEQAGFLQAERDLMIGRLKEKETQVRDVLGEQYLRDHPIFTPDLQKTIQQIDQNIARLNGVATPQAPSASGLPSGWSVKVK